MNAPHVFCDCAADAEWFEYESDCELSSEGSEDGDDY